MHGPGTTEFENFCSSLGWRYIGRPWNDTIWKSGSPAPNFEFIHQLKQQQLCPIVDMSVEHWGGAASKCIEFTYSLLEQNFSRFLLLTHNIADHKTRDKLLFYPYWYYQTQKNFSIPITTISPKQYKVSCLNHRPRFHRKANFVKLHSKSYHAEIFTKILPKDLGNTARPDDYELDLDTIDKWQKVSESLPQEPITNIWNHCQDHTNLAYDDSYINLVTESTVLPEVFITEKTWKAIASGQLFLILGNPGSVDCLRKLGVDTFDDLINHDYYDRESDWEKRLNKLHEILDDVVSQDLSKLWAQTYHRRLDNQNKFLAGAFDPGYKDELLNILSQ
jgi:hypothetical protein